MDEVRSGPAAQAAAGPEDVDVVGLRWKETRPALERHHAALARALPRHWRGTLWLVENDAGPATSAAAEACARRFHPEARVVRMRLRRNQGFARAMDLALDRSTAGRVLLINADSEPQPGAVPLLVAALDADPAAIWAAPAVDGPGETHHPRGAPFAAERLAGTALLVDRARFLRAGGFDPAYFFYNEDAEASDRLRAGGYRLLRVPDARVLHHKDGRTARGQALRERRYAETTQQLVLASDPRPLPRRLLRVAALRRRALSQNLRRGDAAAVGGLLVATATLPAGLLRAGLRRRSPWTGARLEPWLHRARDGVEVVELTPPTARASTVCSDAP